MFQKLTFDELNEGNGRPFVVECANLRRGFTPELLDRIISDINSGCGLNSNLDVEVTWFSEVPKDVWVGMQTTAAEKCKGYCCVVLNL